MTELDLETVRACDLCGADDLVPELEAGSWRLVRCRGCGLVFTSPRRSARRLAGLYRAGYYEGAADYWRTQLSQPGLDDIDLARTALGLSGSSAPRSLDVGCGTGRLVEAFATVGFDATGLEPNRMAAEAGRQRGRNITASELVEAAARSVDCVTAMHVLEHAGSPREFLADCARALRPGGLLIVEVPNYASKASRALGAAWSPLFPDTHLYQFTPPTLRRYLEVAGFRIFRERMVGGAVVDPRPCARPGGAIGAANTTAAPGWRRLLWDRRGDVFRIPLARQALRFLYWQVLGNGEFLRVFARKAGA